MFDKTFQDQYKKLNIEQKKAVDTIDGPVMVIAGPGTGKTTILTLRIANILKITDTSPESILALTFTESGVQAMRKKLVDIIGSAGYKVVISTFHSFCNEVIRQYPERFPKIIGGIPISSSDRVAAMERVIEKSDLELLRPYGNPFHYVPSGLSAIQHLKRENISPDDFETLTKKEIEELYLAEDLYHDKGVHKGKMKAEYKEREHSLFKNKELVTLYKAYEDELAKERYYDFEDMIVETIRALRADENFRLILQEEYQYILADEHQDANNAQNELLEILSSFHEKPNLFVVGDEKQAIFRFQGASLENFMYFKRKFPEAELIKLYINYRSGQSILDASHSLITKVADEGGDLRVPLKSVAVKNTKPIQVVKLADRNAEAEYIAEEAKKKIVSGCLAEEIAVIFRENKEVEKLSAAFSAASIPFVVVSDQNILENYVLNEFIGILRAINNPAEDEWVAKSLFLPGSGISSIEAFKIIREAKEKKMPIIDMVMNTEISRQYGRKLEHWSGQAVRNQAFQFLSGFVIESGFISEILGGEETVANLKVFDGFLKEVESAARGKRDFRLADLIQYLDRLLIHGMSIKSNLITETAGVRLMTAHRSKGLEFSTVFISGLIDGVWGGRRRMGSFNLPSAPDGRNDDDERRLFYVALTRAKESATVTYPFQRADGREALPSQFVAEIDSDSRQFVDLSNEPVKSVLQRQVFQSKSDKTVIDPKFISQIFFEQPLSVTHVNNFLSCPWQYFFLNLVRLPMAKTKHQMYGTVVHETLRIFFEKYKSQEDMSKKEFLHFFESKMRGESLSDVEMKDSLEKGHAALSGWFDAYKNSWSRNLNTEFSISGVSIPVISGGKKMILKLTGKLDRVDFSDDNNATVVDYKTSKPKSRNNLLGKTKDANGDYYRQLVFYKLLLSLYENGGHPMSTAVIDFIEPDDTGKYKREIFEINDFEVEELKKVLIQMAISVSTISFANDTCADKDCQFCALSKELRKKPVIIKDGS